MAMHEPWEMEMGQELRNSDIKMIVAINRKNKEKGVLLISFSDGSIGVYPNNKKNVEKYNMED